MLNPNSSIGWRIWLNTLKMIMTSIISTIHPKLSHYTPAAYSPVNRQTLICNWEKIKTKFHQTINSFSLRRLEKDPKFTIQNLCYSLKRSNPCRQTAKNLGLWVHKKSNYIRMNIISMKSKIPLNVLLKNNKQRKILNQQPVLLPLISLSI